jgi:hypothetical protein
MPGPSPRHVASGGVGKREREARRLEKRLAKLARQKRGWRERAAEREERQR